MTDPKDIITNAVSNFVSSISGKQIALLIFGAIILIIFILWRLDYIHLPILNGTMAFTQNNIARKIYYEKTTLKQRKKDEKTTENLVDDVEIYAVAPTFYDFSGVDEALPPNMSVVTNKTEEMNTGFNKKIVKTVSLMYNNKEIGMIEYIEDPEEKSIYISDANINRKYRRKGLYHFMRREIVNEADKNGYVLRTSSCPYDTGKLSHKQYDEREKMLENHYGSYGDPSKVKKEYSHVVRLPHNPVTKGTPPTNTWFSPPTKYISYDQSSHWHRYRKIDPEIFDKNGMVSGKNKTTFITKKLNPNVEVILGKVDGKIKVQSVRYRKKKL